MPKADPWSPHHRVEASPRRGDREPGLSVRAETDCMALMESRSKMMIGAMIMVKVSPIRVNGSTASVSRVGPDRGGELFR